MKKYLLLLIAVTGIVLPLYANPTARIDTLVIENGNRKIFGLLNRIDSHDSSDKKSGSPIAIIAHGFNGTYGGGMHYIKPLEEIGYQTYVFDFPGGSVNSHFDNNTMNMSVSGQVSDLKAIVEYFRRQPYVDSKNIVVMGESQGGLVSALTASEIPNKIANLILIYPAMMIPEIYTNQIKSLGYVPDTVRVWNVPIGAKYLSELPGIDPYKSLGKYKRRALVINGDADNIVPLNVAEKTNGILHDSSLKIIPGGGHGFNAEQNQMVYDYIMKFLKAGNKR